MSTRLWLAGGLAILAPALLVTGPVSPAAQSGLIGARTDQTVHLAMSGTDLDYVDPALAYTTFSGEIEYETCLKLVNWPDKPAPAGSELVPEAAAAMPVVTDRGKTYTFTIQKGFRFNTGAPVTAANFAYAINRDVNPVMASPAVAFIDDIVGVDAVQKGKASSVSGVIVRGDKLIIRLTRPDGGLLDKLSMNFFCAIPTNLPITREGIDTLPAAGPYYVAGRAVGRQLILKRNPYYTGNRPARAATIVIDANTDQQTAYLQVRQGEYAADLAGPPREVAGELAQQFGVNKGRFFVQPRLSTSYIALNMSRPLFSSLRMRKAMNYAIDRHAFLVLAGALAGRRTDTILPPGLAGRYWAEHLYPVRGADAAKARKLIGGRCGTIKLWSADDSFNLLIDQLLMFDLGKVGCKVALTTFPGLTTYTAAGVKGADYDMIWTGWTADYPDPYDFFHPLLDGTTIHTQNNTNLAYVNNLTLNRRIAHANLLSGQARMTAFGKLDIWTMTHVVPWVPLVNGNSRQFIAPNVGGYVFQPALPGIDLGTLYLK